MLRDFQLADSISLCIDLELVFEKYSLSSEDARVAMRVFVSDSTLLAVDRIAIDFVIQGHSAWNLSFFHHSIMDQWYTLMNGHVLSQVLLLVRQAWTLILNCHDYVAATTALVFILNWH